MIKEACKGGPKWPNKGKACGPKSTPKCYVEERSGLDWEEPTKGWPWGPPRPVVGGARPCMAVLLLALPFLRNFSTSRAFLLCFAFTMLMYRDPIHTQYTPIAFCLHFSFRLVLERKRERRRTARNPLPVFDREIQESTFGWANSFPSPLFSHL